jgi:hypothetical protein
MRNSGIKMSLDGDGGGMKLADPDGFDPSDILTASALSSRVAHSAFFYCFPLTE